MTEKQLNENIIRNKIKGVCQDCMYLDKIVPIINQMLKEEYIKGLEQGKFDKEMETTYTKIRDEICDYLDSNRFCENFENVGNEENVRKNILGILLRGDKE